MKHQRILLLWILLTFLLLSCSQESTVIIPLPEQDLRNTHWILVAFDSIGGAVELLPANEQYPIWFGDGLVNGNGCSNGYEGKYSTGERNTITFSEMRSTRAQDCPSYWPYLRELNNAETYIVVCNFLYLYSKDNIKRLIFRKVNYEP